MDENICGVCCQGSVLVFAFPESACVDLDRALRDKYSSLELTSSGAGLYVMCVSMASSRRASLLTLVMCASHTQ